MLVRRICHRLRLKALHLEPDRELFSTDHRGLAFQCGLLDVTPPTYLRRISGSASHDDRTFKMDDLLQALSMNILPHRLSLRVRERYALSGG